MREAESYLRRGCLEWEAAGGGEPAAPELVDGPAGWLLGWTKATSTQPRTVLPVTPRSLGPAAVGCGPRAAAAALAEVKACLTREDEEREEEENMVVWAASCVGLGSVVGDKQRPAMLKLGVKSASASF